MIQYVIAPVPAVAAPEVQAQLRQQLPPQVSVFTYTATTEEGVLISGLPPHEADQLVTMLVASGLLDTRIVSLSEFFGMGGSILRGELL